LGLATTLMGAPWSIWMWGIRGFTSDRRRTGFAGLLAASP
jgi:hypothetical protein